MTKRKKASKTFSKAKWDVLVDTQKFGTAEIISTLLANRGLTTKEAQTDFMNPAHPDSINLSDIGLDPKVIEAAIVRIKKAIKEKEQVVVFGDYDADGITASAILWETLYALGLSVKPYLPDRFSEGYGIKSDTVKKLHEEGVTLIITVDNGIVAHEAVETGKEVGVDIIITDHHTQGETYPDAFAVIHSTQIGGAAVAWFFAREVRKTFTKVAMSPNGDALELAAMGTIADQIPLIGPNRSIAKHGLSQMNKTKRLGLLALLQEAQIMLGSVRCYDVGFVIAPRINAMGRLEHGMESLRLLCTKDTNKARELSYLLGKTNKERQRIVEEVVAKAKMKAAESTWKGVIVLSDKSFHEGIIGLAAGRLVESFYRPAIVISEGEKESKGSARSISGFNIIEAIRATGNLVIGGGGHPMAAGFTIETNKIPDFLEKLDEISEPLLTTDILTKRIRIDMPLPFSAVTTELAQKLASFEPVGLGNPTPTFVTHEVSIIDARTVGTDAKHLKLKVAQGDYIIDAIGFNMGSLYPDITPETSASCVYTVEENVWNGNTTLQLKLKDIAIHHE